MSLPEIIQQGDSTIKDIHLQSVYRQLLEIASSVCEVSLALHGLSTVWIIWAYGRLTINPSFPQHNSFSSKEASGKELKVKTTNLRKLSSGTCKSKKNFVKVKPKNSVQKIGVVHSSLEKVSQKKFEDIAFSNESQPSRRVSKRKKTNLAIKVDGDAQVVESMLDDSNNDGVQEPIGSNIEEIATDKGSRFRCKTCNAEFRYNWRLVAHQRIHSGEKPFSCLICERKFRLGKNLTKHTRRMHKDELPHGCGKCDKRYYNRRELILHERSHGVVTKADGDVQEVGTILDESDGKLLKTEDVDGDELSETISEDILTDEGLRYKCRTCDAVFRLKRRLVAHERLHTGEKPYSCAVCDRKFRQSKNLAKHTRRMHTTDKAHRCGECDNCYDNRWELVAHKKSHNEVERLFCSICQKPFKTISSLKTHNKRFHTEPTERLQCMQCGKLFAHESSLRSHEMRHNNLPTHKCSFCGKLFHEKSNLEAHIRIHNGERPFQCTTCGMTFNHPSSLRKHELWHSGKKSFMCDKCSKCYLTKQKLKYHQIRHGDVKKHICSNCDRAFFDKNDLKKHMKVHSGIKPFSCEHCGRLFTENWNLKVHVKTVHGTGKLHQCQCGESFMRKNALVEHENSCYKNYPAIIF